MALYKEKTTKFGITAGYWKITTIVIDSDPGLSDKIHLGLYISAETAQPGVEAIETITYSFPHFENEEQFNTPFSKTAEENPYKVAYNFVKELEAFDGSTDV